MTCKTCGAAYGHTPACQPTQDMKALKNFIPQAGGAQRRPGLKLVPWRPRSLWSRFIRWVKDEPQRGWHARRRLQRAQRACMLW